MSGITPDAWIDLPRVSIPIDPSDEIIVSQPREGDVDGVLKVVTVAQLIQHSPNLAAVGAMVLNDAGNPQFNELPVVNPGLDIPTGLKQLATLEYIVNYVLGKTMAKDAVDALAVCNVPLTGELPLIVDGFTFANATIPQRLGLIGQDDATLKGIYTYSDDSVSYTLTRSVDFDQIADQPGTEVQQGAYFDVINGTLWHGYEVQLVTPNPIVVGTTSLCFVKYPSLRSILVTTCPYPLYDQDMTIGNDIRDIINRIQGLINTDRAHAALTSGYSGGSCTNTDQVIMSMPIPRTMGKCQDNFTIRAFGLIDLVSCDGTSIEFWARIDGQKMPIAVVSACLDTCSAFKLEADVTIIVGGCEGGAIASGQFTGYVSGQPLIVMTGGTSPVGPMNFDCDGCIDFGYTFSISHHSNTVSCFNGTIKYN